MRFYVLQEMIRNYQEGDHAAIAKIFCRAIHEIASEDYSPNQCLAWSSLKPNPTHWKTRCELKKPFVAIINSQIAGFLELDPDGHIDCAYVNPDYRRQGVMTRLVKHAVAITVDLDLPEIFVEASICARPLFAREGFELISENNVEIDGITLLNFRMHRKNTKKQNKPAHTTAGNAPV